ncbi:Hypothetical protein, putative [Bodo saltans]|uniref:Uncharacterized protein n=1 Tax=Bodo saltans TaxID=75058 RepID=A0A0S4JU00_BODSA|nr:Hypothetical protein, putative [Bodo saltans]|eukprot:CUG92846.1 Hypothetical protein, putative [Bodo saltans]
MLLLGYHHRYPVVAMCHMLHLHRFRFQVSSAHLKLLAASHHHRHHCLSHQPTVPPSSTTITTQVLKATPRRQRQLTHQCCSQRLRWWALCLENFEARRRVGQTVGWSSRRELRVAEPQHPSFSSTTFAAPLQQQRAGVVAGQLREDHQHLSSAASAPNVSTAGATTAVGAPNIIAAPLASHRHNNPPPSAPPVLQSTSTATPPAPVDVLADHRAPLPSLVNPSEQEDDLFNMLTGVNPHAHRTSTTTTTVTTTTSSLTTNQNPTISNVNHVAASAGTTVAPLPPPVPPTIHPNAQVSPQHATTTTVNDSISTVDSLPTPPPSPPLKPSSSGQHVMNLHVAPPLPAHDDDDDDADALDWDQVLLPKTHQAASQRPAGEPDRVPLDSARSTIPELTDEAYDDGHSQAVVAHVPLARPAIENDTDRNDDASLEESLQGDEPISVVMKKTIATSQMSTRTTTMIQPSSKNAPPRFTSEAVVGAGGLSLTPRLTFDALRKYGPSAQQPTPSAAVLQSSSTSIVSSSSRWEGAGRVAPLRALVRNQSATYGDNNNIGELMDESVVLSSAAVAVYDAPAQKMRPSVQQQHRVDPFALVTTSVTAPSEMDDTTSSLPDLDDWSQQAASGAVHSTFVAAERGRITTHQPSQPLHAVHVAPSLTVSGTVNSTIQQQLSLQLPTLHQKLRSHKLHHSSLLNESDALDVTLSEASLNSSLRSNSSLQDQYYKSNNNAPDGFFTISHPHQHNSSSSPMATHYAPPSPLLAKAAQQRQDALGHFDFRRSMKGVPHQSSPQWTTSSARTHPSQLSHALSQSQQQRQQRDDMSPLQQTSHQYSVVVAGTPSRVPQHQPHPSPSRDYLSSSMVLSSSPRASPNSSTWTAAHHGSGERRAPLVTTSTSLLGNSSPQYYDGADVQWQQRMSHIAPPPPPPSASSPSSYQSPLQYYASHTHRLHDGHAYDHQQQPMATPTGAASRYLPNITVDPPSSPRGSPRRRIAPNRSPGSGVSDFLTPGGGRGKGNSQQRQSNEFLSPLRRPSDMMHSAERNRRILQRHLFSGDDD